MKTALHFTTLVHGPMYRFPILVMAMVIATGPRSAKKLYTAMGSIYINMNPYIKGVNIVILGNVRL